MAWWIWIVFGLLLGALEMFVGGALWLLLAGAAAVIVGLLAGIGVSGLPAQGILFAMLLASAFLIRRRLRPSPERVAGEPMTGEAGTALSRIGPGAPGAVRMRGTRWPARTAGSGSIRKGAGVRVVRMDGITLFVEPE